MEVLKEVVATELLKGNLKAVSQLAKLTTNLVSLVFWEEEEFEEFIEEVAIPNKFIWDDLSDMNGIPQGALFPLAIEHDYEYGEALGWYYYPRDFATPDNDGRGTYLFQWGQLRNYLDNIPSEKLSPEEFDNIFGEGEFQCYMDSLTINDPIKAHREMLLVRDSKTREIHLLEDKLESLYQEVSIIDKDMEELICN